MNLRKNVQSISTNSAKTVNDMDNIEKIKEWIKKQKKEELARNSIGVITGKALFVDANELLSFLDTLSEEPDKSLEKAAENYIAPIENDEGLDYINFNGRDIKDAFIAGASWQKQQMLKDAVEGVVCILPGSVAYVDERDDNTLKQYIIDNFKAGDKVKIVIVKED